MQGVIDMTKVRLASEVEPIIVRIIVNVYN